MAHQESEQPMLPIEIRGDREVWWINVKQVETRSRLLGRRALKKEYIYGKSSYLPSTTEISVNKIDDINDTDLRYALRFQDAAEAAGLGHFVTVEATKEGADSKLVQATYSGIVGKHKDTFIQDLHRQAPQPEVPGMIAVLAPGEDGSPDTRFWVRSE